jgi:CheY-like chemotaxis protein
MRILFLDDDPARHQEFEGKIRGLQLDVTPVTTSAEAIAAIESTKFDVIFLDHDLNGQIYVDSGPGTGFEVAQKVLGTLNKDAQVIVHTINEKGARAMLEVLGKTAVWVPFPQISVIINALKLRFRPR